MNPKAVVQSMCQLTSNWQPYLLKPELREKPPG